MRRLLIGLVWAPICSTQALAWDGDCRHREDRSVQVEVGGATVVEVIARAGQLEVSGRSGAVDIVVSGEACASDADDLDRIRIVTERDGDRVRVIADIPPVEDSRSQRRLDMALELPAHLRVEVTDTSGDLRIEDVAGATVRDSSGDLRIGRIAGDVHIVYDSSGDIRVADVGDLLIDSDSSGGIDIERARSVRILADSSGDIEVQKVSGDVEIGSDSSGSIYVREVGGSFTVRQDSSGSIEYRAVVGKVDIPRYKD